MVHAPNLNYLWAAVIVEELVRQGVGLMAMASGSRCTPFTVAVAQHGQVETLQHVDERGCGFAAVGYARATGRPSAVLTTSGTAVANLFPAVAEASEDGLPLVVLSTDRPPRLRHCGANQTMNQVELFGSTVRWFHDLVCPTTDVPLIDVLKIIGSACQAACGELPGPVHLNCMLDEPLHPEPNLVVSSYVDPIRDWMESDEAYVLKKGGDVSVVELEPVLQIVRKARKGLLLVGRLQGESEIAAVRALSDSLRWPVLADTTSGLRFGADQLPVVAGFDVLLQCQAWRAEHRADVVLQVGRRFVSKHVLAYAAEQTEHYVVVCPDPRPLDSLQAVTHRVTMNLSLFCKSLLEVAQPSVDKGWVRAWRDTSRAIQCTLSGWFAEQERISESYVARAVSRLIPVGHGLFVANSMPVRDLDQVAVLDGPKVPVAANRGVSGIDGIVMSAIGYAVGLRKPVTLLIGDLALLHDLNALLAAGRCGQPLSVVVINNRGGGIFSFLPIAAFEDVFERWFGTPHDVAFEKVAEAFGLSYQQPHGAEDFRNAYQTAVLSGTSSVIEVQTDRLDNVKVHEELERLTRSAAD